MPSPVARNAPQTPAARPAAAVLVNVVVLTGDLPLFEAARSAIGERNPVWRARSAEESVDLLMSGRCGVLLIDMATVSTQPTALVEQIVEQFPDVVVVVAGRREDEATLAKLISEGLVYRFMHKPLSEKRAGMFLSAAVRCHAERMQGRIAEPLLQVAGELGSRMDPRKWAFVTVGLALFLVALAILLVSLDDGRHPVPAPARTVQRPVPPPASAPLADPVLSRARAALAAGRLESPAGRNALDLYSAVLLARPDNPEARDGLAETKRRLVADATAAAAAGDVAEARRLAARVLGVDPGDAAARALIRRLEVPAAAVRALPPPVSMPPIPEPAAIPATRAAAPTTTAAGAGAAPSLPSDRLSRVPVTRLGTNAGSVAPPVVRADPLAPRLLPSGPSMRVAVPSRASGSAPVLPPGPEHAIAGYVKDARPPPEPVVAAAAPAGVERRDLEQVVRIEPVYPPEAFRSGVSGWVDVDFTVTEDGRTRDIRVVAADPRAVFDDAAIAAVAQWQYRPRVVNGRAVPQRSSVTLRFEVDR